MIFSSDTRDRIFVFVLVFAVLLAIGASAYVVGNMHGKASIRAQLKDLQDQLDKASRELREALDNKETKIVTEVQERIVYVEVKGDTIIKKVPVYVPQEVDRACPVPMGFVSVYDAAVIAGNEAGAAQAASSPDSSATSAADPVPVPQWIAEPSGVPLSEVAAVSAANAKSFGILKERFIGLREWAQTQCYGPAKQ